jgi:hypothetical protein
MVAAVRTMPEIPWTMIREYQKSENILRVQDRLTPAEMER